jgi:hypothetical protein
VMMEHAIESYIRQTFEIESPEQLKRPAYVVLAHVLVDTHLIVIFLAGLQSGRGSRMCRMRPTRAKT